MLKAPDKKGPHSCEECGPVCCGSVLGALRRYPDSGPGMPSGIGNRYETSSPSILGLDSSWFLVDHGVTSLLDKIRGSVAFAVSPYRVQSYTIIPLYLVEKTKNTTKCCGRHDLAGIQSVPNKAIQTACRGGAE